MNGILHGSKKNLFITECPSRCLHFFRTRSIEIDIGIAVKIWNCSGINIFLLFSFFTFHAG